MWKRIRNIRHLSLIGLLALAACGGDDGGAGSAVSLGAANNPAGTAAPTKATVNPGTPPVEMPDTVVPVNYKLWFRPSDDLSQFQGRADVEINVKQAVNAIVVAGHRIQFTNGRITLQPGNIELIATPQGQGDYYQLRPASGTIPRGNYSLHMEWQGIINFDSHGDPAQGTVGSCDNDPYPGCSAAEGMFRVDLVGTDGTSSGAVLTQGESDLARQWFPGWDEPAFRPTYEVSAEVPQAWRVVSNAAEKPAASIGGGYKLVSFEKTPPMPSYLLFFGGGKFDTLEDDFTSPLPDGKGLHLRIFTPPGMSEWAKPAMQETKQALDYYYRYTGIALPLTKFDTIAANDKFKAQKDLNFGGMENWGSILEFADDILPKPGTPMSRYGLTVLTHEAAHQWFGDLVTLDWWDDVWLNESFATYFETRTTIQFHPDVFNWVQDAGNKAAVIKADIGPDAFPVQPNFNAFGSNDFVINAGTFVYDKGGHVLKMLEGYLGDEVMRKGLQQYLADYSFGNGTPQRLWDALSNASGQKVGPIGDSFVRQTGVPLLSLDTQCDLTKNQNIVTLKQAPFPNRNAYPGTQWTIPVTLAYGDGLINRKTLALSDTQTQVRLDGCSAVLANPTGFDYYVTNYSDTAWSALLPQLSRVNDPVLLTNLRNDAALLVSNQLAPASRSAALTSVSGPAAVSLRQLATAQSVVRQARPVVRYHGKFVARQRQVQ
ncbi:M1 family metallopeptidase [Burkholderia plantarii]|uniref:M1 family metallopeptidase n=1 Tax=Burkholderia plantarii TaxID=41899 RepID=UPI0018DC8693|nr:M1 family metallopeptidase [Burkholderia plantarii]MBI0328664.1 peptidase M1 [Burkholderia plantarii]